MNEETHGALKRIIAEVEEKREGNCPMKDCMTNDMIGGDDIDIAKKWLKENKAKHDVECDCARCCDIPF